MKNVSSHWKDVYSVIPEVELEHEPSITDDTLAHKSESAMPPKRREGPLSCGSLDMPVPPPTSLVTGTRHIYNPPFLIGFN